MPELCDLVLYKHCILSSFMFYPCHPPDPLAYLSLGGQMSVNKGLESSTKELHIPPNNRELISV